MRNRKLMIYLPIVVLSIAAFFACEQNSIDPDLVLDEVFIPEGYAQTDKLSMDVKARLDELRLENPGHQYYHLTFEKGPVSSSKDLMFPQRELLIEYMDTEKGAHPGEKPKFKGVIAKKIKGDWRNEEFKYFDDQPMPVNGIQALYAAISESINYPAEAKKAGVEGKVFVEFIVAKNGELSKVKVVKGIGYGCDEEAVRVLKEVSKWLPAKVNGANVDVRMILPINYKLG